MAVRQRLTEVYQSELERLPSKLQSFWEQKLKKLSAVDPDMSPGERFNTMIETGLSDTVILYGSRAELLYPCEVEPPHLNITDNGYDWDQAESLEFKSKEYQAAARLYSDIAGKLKDISLSARALQRQVRCLDKAGKKEDAANIVTGALSSPEYSEARDDNGRLIAPDSKLFVLQSMINKTDPEFSRLLESLVLRVRDYGPPVMPSSQRLFLMKALMDIENSIEFPSFAAEKLALFFKAHVFEPGQDGLVRVSGRKDLWKVTSFDKTVTALFNQGRVERETQQFINSNESYTGIQFLFALKDAERDSRSILRIDAGSYFPDWELTVLAEGDDLYMEASEKQVSLYIWTAVLISTGILILAVITTRLFVRQMSLARIKNDLITTVSHELKTPLTSIQLLVDTLIEGRYEDKGQEKEYHELISRETERLTAMVENFLTFSRIEDKRQTFDFKLVEPGEIVRSVYNTIRHRFESGGFTFEMKVHEGIPDITVDFDAITMVLLNLLDNACNYSDKVKSVKLSAYQINGFVCFEVRDKGIGMSSDQKKKILKPFYQADQTMSRKKSGFGLGLSIVRSIVDVHHGSIEIESEPGKGSVFTVKVPVA